VGFKADAKPHDEPPLIKRDRAEFLSFLVGKDQQFMPIEKLGFVEVKDEKLAIKSKKVVSGKALAFVIADFALEYPDALQHKLHRHLRLGDSPGIADVSFVHISDQDPATYLWQIVFKTLGTRSAEPVDIAAHLNKLGYSAILRYTLTGDGQKDRRFVAKLIEAWESLPVAPDQPTHFLLLVNEIPASGKVSWLAHWRLCGWMRTVEALLLKKSRHSTLMGRLLRLIINRPDRNLGKREPMVGRVLRPARSPSLGLQDILDWRVKDLPDFNLNQSQTGDIHQFALDTFKQQKKLAYSEVRPQLKSQLEKLIHPKPTGGKTSS